MIDLQHGDSFEVLKDFPDSYFTAYICDPTMKPVELMRWLARMVKMPGENRVLDPFLGSGSTGIACAREGLDFVGVEQSAEYLEIARRRIEGAK